MYRKKDYQQRYDEGFRRGVEVAKDGARAEAFTILMELMEKSGLKEEEDKKVLATNSLSFSQEASFNEVYN